MRAMICAVLVASIAGASACAARSARPDAPRGETAPRNESAQNARYREMTWAEYYTDVTERAWRRGATVVWVNPPNVHRPKRSAPENAPQ